MKVVAFLQNCWFKEGTPSYITNKYLEDSDYRRRILALSTTGRRLSQAFGQHFRDIHWDNASDKVGNYSAAKFAADPVHMQRVIDSVHPEAIVTFGAIAKEGIDVVVSQWCQCPWPVQFYAAPHPVAFGLTQAQLNEFAEKIIKLHLM